MSYRLLVSDVAGTLVSDDGVVLAAFESSLRQTDAEGFAVHGKHWRGVAEETMGQSKQSVFLRILGSLELAERATAAFEASYQTIWS